ncbi:DEAD/DEAH box helicase [Marinobacter sp.]|uniref:DEAD/DEAH box helicase n=1 Tax=Marinobacter sp. TaxID=50741 RepID=UPI003A8CFDA1
MDLEALKADERTSLYSKSPDVDKASFGDALRHLHKYEFWDGTPGLWEHQQAAIGTAVAYIHGNKTISERPDLKEAALLKLPTGTGKSGIVAVLSRCLPNVRRVLVLTPRTALTEQLISDIRYRFWKHIGYQMDGTELFTGSADSLGGALEDAYVEQLLTRSAHQIAKQIRAEDVDRAILIGTHQALGDIRKISKDPEHARADSCLRILEEIQQNFDLIIVDEGHYEPAISWSRGVREFNLPTILLSATPYRNDYKSFRVRGNYLFNFPYEQSVENKIIRPVEIVAPTEVPKQEPQSAIKQFIEILQQELPEKLERAKAWFSDGKTPKVMVRGDDLDTLMMLQNWINSAFGTQAVLIHDKAKKTLENPNRFTSVASALRSRPDATFWIHQNKLMEGIDNPEFIAVGIFDLMSNARQLVQQIGRITRHSDGDQRYRQSGFVICSPANASRVKQIWERYKGYEDYAARNTAHIVSNEVTLPDRLLEYMAEYQYISGEFRARFEFEKALSAKDIQLPRTAAVFSGVEPLIDITKFAPIVEEALLNEDRFKISPIEGMPENAFGFSYYAWRNSPYLVDRFFSEWKLGIFVAVLKEGFVLMHDTEGLVVDKSELNLKRASRSLMEKAFPDGDEGNKSRLSRMSFSSLDMSQHAIRGLAMRTRSFADVFTDLLDPSLVPATAAGFVDGTARYIGFARSRVRDASERYVSLSQYIDWCAEVVDEITDGARSRSRVFDRYAAIVEDVTTDEAQPVSILLDPSPGDVLDNETGITHFALDEDVNYFDLCSDVEPGNGTFFIEIDDERIECSIQFEEKTRKYQIESEALNARFPPPEHDNRKQGRSVVQRLNQQQAFRVLTSREGVIYSEGSFYQPRLLWSLEDGSKPILDYIYAARSLEPVVSEKGEDYFFKNIGDWYRQSIFGLFAAICEGKRAPNGIDADDLTAEIEDVPIWLCDDDSKEIADFIGIDPEARKMILVHAKVGAQKEGGRGFNVGGLQEVGRQALACLSFISIGSPSSSWTP